MKIALPALSMRFSVVPKLRSRPVRRAHQNPMLKLRKMKMKMPMKVWKVSYRSLSRTLLVRTTRTMKTCLLREVVEI
jgi:hypothetical protein